MTFYPEALQDLVEEFQEVEDKRERLEMLFELADEIVELPAAEWSDETRAYGAASPRRMCVSKSKTAWSISSERLTPSWCRA